MLGIIINDNLLVRGDSEHKIKNIISISTQTIFCGFDAEPIEHRKILQIVPSTENVIKRKDPNEYKCENDINHDKK